MSTYSVSQVGPIDGWGALDGVAPGKAFVEEALGNEFVGISVNGTEPGGTSPFWHTHSKLEEIYIFIDGTGELALDDEVIAVGAGTIARVGPNVWRGLRCSPDSPTQLKWLCIRAGGDTLAHIGNDADLDGDRPYPWD